MTGSHPFLQINRVVNNSGSLFCSPIMGTEALPNLSQLAYDFIWPTTIWTTGPLYVTPSLLFSLNARLDYVLELNLSGQELPTDV
jgi:hypothetical protein